MIKIYFMNTIKGILNVESAQRTTDEEICVLLSKENSISRDFGSEIYISSQS